MFTFRNTSKFFYPYPYSYSSISIKISHHLTGGYMYGNTTAGKPYLCDKQKIIYKHHLNAGFNQEIEVIMTNDQRNSDYLRNMKCVIGTKRMRTHGPSRKTKPAYGFRAGRWFCFACIAYLFPHICCSA